MISPESLAAIRAAAGPAMPVTIRWRPEVRDDLRWPALAKFRDPDTAARTEFRDWIMREYVQHVLGLTPSPDVGKVGPAGGAQQPTGAASGQPLRRPELDNSKDCGRDMGLADRSSDDPTRPHQDPYGAWTDWRRHS